MSYFKKCPYCTAHLDPGERCDCQDKNDKRTADCSPTVPTISDEPPEQTAKGA